MTFSVIKIQKFCHKILSGSTSKIFISCLLARNFQHFHYTLLTTSISFPVTCHYHPQGLTNLHICSSSCMFIHSYLSPLIIFSFIYCYTTRSLAQKLKNTGKKITSLFHFVWHINDFHSQLYSAVVHGIICHMLLAVCKRYALMPSIFHLIV